MEGVYQRAQAELNDPRSPYYLKAPTTADHIERMMGGIKTNYFGPNAKNYLARKNVDTVELLHKMRDKRNKRNWMYGLGNTAVAAFLFRKKIPIINWFFKK